MKKTRTRIGSILLALALVLTLLPATALAAEIPVVGGELEAGTYTLTKDTSLGQKLVVPVNADVTIDLAGYTLDFSACGANCMEVYGALTIKDSSEEEKGKILGNYCIVIDAGKLTLESGTIEITKDYGLYAKNDGEIVVNGGEITSLYAPLTGNNTTGDMNFEVNAGVLTAEDGPAIYMPGQVELTITGGTLNGGISLRMGQVEISGGTINAMTSGSDDPKDYYDYSGNAWLPDALYVFNGTYNSDNATYGNSLNMTITGGTFVCENSDGSAIAIYDLGKVQQSSHIQISGDAELTTKASARSAYQVLNLDDIGVTDPKTGYGTYSDSVESSITGGTFSSDVSKYVADGYESVPQGNQWIVDSLDNLAVAQVDGQKYASLSEAIGAASTGSTISLLDDAKAALPDFTGDKDLTFDLGGNTLTMTGERIAISGGADITFKNGTIIANGIADKVTQAIISVNLNSSVTLDNIAFNTDATALMASGDAASVNVINGSVINAKGYCFGTNASTTDNYGVVITLKDSTFNGSDAGAGTAMYLNVPGTMNIDNCEINGYFHGLFVRGGTADIRNSTIVNTMDDNSLSDYFENRNWGSGNTVNLAALTLGNKNPASYNYPTNVTLTNTTIISAGKCASDFPAIYVWANEDEGKGVTVTYDNCTIDGAVIYGNNGKNIQATVESGPVLVGDTYYLTLAEAIQAAHDGAIIQVLKDIPNAVGISVPSGKKFTIDFGGHTYTLTGPGAGSTNTETNGFQLLKDSAITLRNGTIRIAENANNVKRIIQNYADLTLEDMQIYAENQVGGEAYTLSFNNGNITFKGNTSVFTTSNKTIAFDVYYWASSYPNGTRVTFAPDYTGTINGIILYDSTDATKAALTIQGKGSFGRIDISSGSTKTPNISITGGYFTSDPTDYVASGYVVDVSDKAGYTYKVIEAGEITTVTKPSVEEPKVEMGGGIAEEDQNTVEDAVKKTEVAEIAAAAVNQANKLSESTKNAAANQLKDEIEVEEDEVITIFVQTYLDIKPTAYDEDEKTLTLDITPMYQLVASTAAKAENVELGKNAVEYGDPKELTISGKTEVSITLPNGFLSGSQNVYVKHSKDGRFVAYHKATIENNVLTFVNDKGFSTFEITKDTRSATVTFGSDTKEYTPVDVGDALPVVSAPSGQRFAGWTFPGIEGTYTTLTDDLLTQLAKQNNPITATASFVDAPSGGSGSSGVSGDYIISVDKPTGGKVTVNPGRADKGDEVTITAIPNDGYVLQSLTVTDKDGDTVRVSSEGNDKYTFTMPGSTVTVKAVFVREGGVVVTPGEVFFTDVTESYWAYNEIQWAAENGYMTGTTATTFNPGGTVTRQQVWMILARMAGARPADMAAAKAWAVNNGISDGTNPGGSVTRQQLVALLYRFAGQNGYNVSAKADLSGYPDVASLASYATDAMAWSVANSIIGGTTAGTLNPAGTANRAQFAVILWRFYQTTAV